MTHPENADILSTVGAGIWGQIYTLYLYVLSEGISDPTLRMNWARSSSGLPAFRESPNRLRR